MIYLHFFISLVSFFLLVRLGRMIRRISICDALYRNQRELNKQVDSVKNMIASWSKEEK